MRDSTDDDILGYAIFIRKIRRALVPAEKDIDGALDLQHNSVASLVYARRDKFIRYLRLRAARHADGYGNLGSHTRKNLRARYGTERYFYNKFCIFFERFVDGADKAGLK